MSINGFRSLEGLDFEPCGRKKVEGLKCSSLVYEEKRPKGEITL